MSCKLSTTCGAVELAHAISGVPRVSRAQAQTQFWGPHPARSWQHICEERVGNNWASKADSALQSPVHVVVSRPIRKLPVIVTSQNWRQDFWIFEIINYRRVKNLIVSREAIPSEIWLRLNIQTVLSRPQIVHHMQTVDPTSFNNEVLPHSAVMVYSRGKQHVDRPVDRRVSVVQSRLILHWIDKIDKKNIFWWVFQKVHKNEKCCILWHFVLVTLLPTGRSRLMKKFSSRPGQRQVGHPWSIQFK